MNKMKAMPQSDARKSADGRETAKAPSRETKPGLRPVLRVYLG